MSVDRIAILDFGSQFSQLIARRVREAGVYCELFPWDAPAERLQAFAPRGLILSGGPNSVYDAGAPTLPAHVLAAGLPVLGICYGMQLLARALGGSVAPAAQREYGAAEVALARSGLWPRDTETVQVWMSHGDSVVVLPPGFVATGTSSSTPIAAMADEARRLYGLQFHPEVNHTPRGRALIEAFVHEVCGCGRTWTAGNIVEEGIATIRARVGARPVICGLSGGVDSAVAAALIHRAVGDALTCVFVDTGLLRHNEGEQVVKTFRESLGIRLIAVNASEAFLSDLAGVSDPEEKRRRIGHRFVRVFEETLAGLPAATQGRAFLAQGTLYPDVIESRGPERQSAAKIKTHHNVGGLPADMQFDLLEPLRMLFKDEVRALGVELGLPEALVWRQPFPGPGLAVRCLGEVTWERVERLRAADAIAQAELARAGLMRATSQAFVVLLPVRSVGVMGDGRTYHEVCALRAVTTDDFMTADWARLPSDVLATISSRIVNEVPGINRVVYDITSKPPATIEWE
ncbi:MAG: glutamine-hydrolyzing GMP synthase [Thermoflexales bacterium]|nr:glutamine-hydrolyzing GMP synthase [Thermoflexales bacterium]